MLASRSWAQRQWYVWIVRSAGLLELWFSVEFADAIVADVGFTF